MFFLGDYHTHTIYSHGRGTIEENVLKAISIGLKEIAITDHGFRHGAYHVRRMDWSYMKAETARMKKKYPMINIYLGLETNLVGLDGAIDIKDSDIKDLDLLVCGYHKYVKTSSMKSFFGFAAPNFVLDTIGKSSVKQTVRNTDAYINAIRKHDIDIISHPNRGIKTYISEIAKAAKHFGTYLELNCKRVDMTREEIDSALEAGAEFIVDSDAHSTGRIGDFAAAIEVIEKNEIPRQSIANLDKLPKFRSRMGKNKEG